MLTTSDAAFGFGQGVTGGAVDKNQRQPGGLSALTVNNKASLKAALQGLTVQSVLPTTIILSPGVYDFTGETQNTFTISAKNVTLQSQRGTNGVAQLKNFGLVLDLASIDNILIQNLAFHSDGTALPNDAILFDGENATESSSSLTNKVRITHCTFDGYKDEAIEIRTRYSRLLATIDHCYFFDSQPGQGVFKDRGAINIASVILSGGTRTTANSFVTVAFNYFENVWRRSPRAAAGGTHAHVFNNLLYRWGYQANGLTTEGSWNGMEVGALDDQQSPTQVAEAVIQANRFIPWVDKQNKAISHDAGTQVNIGQTTNLVNRFDKPNGTSGNATLDPGDGFQSINVNNWYTSVNIQAPTVKATKKVDWVNLARSAGTFVRPANSIPDRVSADPGK